MASNSEESDEDDLFYSTPENESNRDVPRLVVAVDFGTYGSGYAFQFRSDYDNDRTKINYNTKWQTGGLCTYKTTTCILLKPDKSFDSFGYEAQLKFANLREEVGEEHDKWFFFRFFKMMLYRKEDLSETTPLESASGACLPAILVFSKAIEHMKNHFIENLELCGLRHMEKQTQWVLTVPAIWNDQAKQFMRKVAEKAGIPSDRLLLSLEPEAAAIYCSQISANQLEIQGDEGRLQYVAAPGSTVMVVDLGGGTVDITTVKIGTDGSMKQAYESNGDDSGGMKVNEKFISLLHEVVGLHIWEEFAANEKQDEYEISMEFELRKREIRVGNDSRKKIVIRLPATLKDIWERKSDLSVTENLSRLGGRLRGKVNFASSRLSIDVDLIKEFFEDTISGILNKVKDAHRQSSIRGRIDAVLLVGGFSQSNLVTTRVRAGLEDIPIPVVRPQNPELAVLGGAVLFGHNPNIMTSRVLRHTYGIGMTVDFVPEKYDEVHKFEAPDGNCYVRDVFGKHVERGQEVKINEWTNPVDYCVDERGQMSAEVYIYTSENKGPIYTDGCAYIGKLSVDFRDGERPRLDSRRNKSIEVSMCFGGTELKVRAVDKTTKREYKAILKLI